MYIGNSNFPVTVDGGSFSVTGADVGFIYVQEIGAGVGTVAVTGANATLDYSGDVATYPNRPDGMTMFYQFDGTNPQSPNGPSNDFWYSAEWQANVESVVDATNPIGTGYSLKLNFLDGNQGAGRCKVDEGFAWTVDELYFMYRVYYDPNWEMLGQKNFYWGTAVANRSGGGPTHYYTTIEWDVGGDIHVSNQYAGTVGNVLNVPNVWNNHRGAWHEMEMHVVAESSPGAYDGEVYYWLDDVLIDSATDVSWTDGGDPSVQFTGMEWYCVRNGYNTYDTWFKVGEFYCGGK